jgi:hypothetical protein
MGLTKALNADEIKFLKRLIQKNTIIKKDDFIFHCGKSTKPEIRANNLDKTLNLFIKQCEIFKDYDKKDLTTYIMRRSGAELEREKQTKILQKVANKLGHKNNINNTKYYIKPKYEKFK